MIETIYRAMRMIAAAMRVRWGVVIVVQKSTIDQTPTVGL